jgi:RNA 3'-terminal phosphate cyclase (ATP)
MLQIDASYGEGGGQLVRTAVALSAITGVPVHLQNMRAGRDRPGLAPQHLAAVRAVAALCDAACTGLELRSQTLTFEPGPLRAGAFRFDVGTAGSVTLVLQALLPALLHAPGPCTVTVSGGTDVRAAPPLDYFRQVLLGLLQRMGATVGCRVRRRGHYPRGGGEVEIAVQPTPLNPADFTVRGHVSRAQGLAHVANLPLHIAERMRDAARDAARSIGVALELDTAVLGPDDAVGTGGAVACWVQTENAVLGAGRVAQRGVRAETLGQETGAELAADLAAGVCFDTHAADQMLVYLAQTGGRFTTRTISSHARTAMWLIRQFMPVRFCVDTERSITRVEVSRQ